MGAASTPTPDRGPVPATIVFTLKPDADREAAIEKLSFLWSCLQGGAGLTHRRPAEFWCARDTPNVLLLHVLFFSDAAAASWTEHPKVVSNYGDAFRTFLARPPETRLHADLFVGDRALCGCDTPSGYLVDGGDYEVMHVTCLDCRGPLLEDAPVGGWAQTYERVQTMWMQNDFEAWSAQQLSDPESELNREGREACADLEKKLGGTPVYLEITAWDAETTDLVALERCPACDAEGEPAGEDWNVRVCRPCRLAFMPDVV